MFILRALRALLYNYPSRIIYIARMRIYDRKRPRNQRISELAGDSKDTVFILANGPSLNDSIKRYNDTFRDGTVMCVNFFFDSEQFFRVKPQYYIWSDPLYFGAKEDLLPSSIDAIDRMRAKFEMVDWHINFIVPENARDSYFTNSLSSANVCFFFFSDYAWPKVGFPDHVIYRYLSRDYIVPKGTSVANTAVSIALYMNFKEIYLFGADFSLHEEVMVDQLDNQAYTVSNHFYGKDEKRRLVYNVQGKKVGMKMGTFFEVLSRWHNECYFLNDYADYKQCHVYNSSESSYLDAYVRKQPDVNKGI